MSSASFDRDFWPADQDAAEEVELEDSSFVVWRYDPGADAWQK